MRRAIAAAMARSKREIPHYYLGDTIDIEHARSPGSPRRTSSRPSPERLLPGVLLIKAVALALREVPELNGVLDATSAFRPATAIHVGVAISLRGGGLVAPALHDADQPSARRADARAPGSRRARARRRRCAARSSPTRRSPSRASASRASRPSFGVIYPAAGRASSASARVVERPWVVDGQVVPRPVVTATLSADHRVTDGHRGGALPRRRRPPSPGAGEAMTSDEIRRRSCRACSARSRPRPTRRRSGRDVGLRDQLDLDSMDFLNFVIAIDERLGVSIPEADYSRLPTLDAFVAYLGEKLGSTGG